MGLVSNFIKKSTGEAIQHGVTKLIPGGQAAIGTIDNRLKEKDLKIRDKLHQKSGDQILDDDEYNYAIKAIKRQWSFWRAPMRFIKWIMPGMSAVDDHVNAVNKFAELATNNKERVDFFAYEAVETLSNYMSKRFKKGSSGLSKLLNIFKRDKDFKLKQDKILMAYADAIEKWIPKLAISNQKERNMVEQLRDRFVNDQSIPQFLHEKLDAAYNQRYQEAFPEEAKAAV